jgi:hypothetical protein
MSYILNNTIFLIWIKSKNKEFSMKKIAILSLVLVQLFSIIYFSACETEPKEDNTVKHVIVDNQNQDVNVQNWPQQQTVTFPSPTSVSVIADPDDPSNKARVTWTIVPEAVQYIIYIRGSNGYVIQYTPTEIKLTYNNNNTLYTNINKDVFDGIIPSGNTKWGVCAISYDGIYSSIKYNN